MFNSKDTILFESNPIPMWIYNKKTHNIIDVNKRALSQYGYSKTEFLSLTIEDLACSDTTTEIPLHLNENQENSTCLDGARIRKHMTKSGKEFHVEIRSQTFQHEKQRLKLVQARKISEQEDNDTSLQDIESELLYHLGNTPLGVIEWDSQFHLKHMNEKVSKISEFSFKELRGKSARELALTLVHPADREKTLQKIEELKQGHRTQNQLSIRITSKYGTLKYIQLFSSAKVDQGGQLTSAFTFIEDRTDQKTLEKSRSRLTDMIEETPDLIAIIDPDGNLIYLNSTGREVFEIENQSTPYQFHIEDFNPRKSIEKFNEQILPLARKEGVWKGILELKKIQSGQTFLTSSVIISHKNEYNEVEYYSAILRDISRQLETKRQLLEQNTRLSLAMEGGQIGFWNYYPKTQEIDVDAEWVETMLGYTKNELDHEPSFWLQLIHPDDIKSKIGKFQELLDGKISFYEAEIRLKKDDGSWIWILARAKVVVSDQEGRPIQVSGIYFDIDSKKRAELKIKQEHKNQQVVKDVALIVNSDQSVGRAMQGCLARIARYLGCPIGHIFYGETTFSSSKFWFLEEGSKQQYDAFVKATEQVEFKPDEGLVGKVALSDIIHWFNLQEDATSFKRSEAAYSTGLRFGVLLSVLVQGKIVALLEFYGPNKIEKTKQLRKTLDTIRILLGRLLERRQFMDALKNEKVKYQLLAENSTDMISRHAPDGTFLYLSPAVTLMLDYKPEELVGASPYEYIHPEDTEIVEKSHQKLLEETHIVTLSYRFKCKNGGYKWVETRSKTIYAPGSEDILEIQATTRDISERKEIERELKEEKDFISTAIESLPGLFYMIDENQNYILWNKNFEKKFGYDSNEIEQMHPLDFYHEKDHELITSKIQQVLRTGKAEVEIDIYDKQGNAHRHYVTGRKFETEGTTYIVGSGVDITKRTKIRD